MVAPLSHLHLAILVALSTGPVALIALGQMLPSCRDFGRELGDLLQRGWIRELRHFTCDYEVTDEGRRAMQASVPEPVV